MISRQAKVIAAFTTVYIVWGSTYLAILFAIETLPPFLMAGLRFLCAGIILFAIVRRTNTIPLQLRWWKSAAIIGGLLILGGNGGVVWAEQFVPSGIASLFIATVPLWMVMLDAIWNKKHAPPAGVFIGIAMGIGGIWILINPLQTGQNLHPIGACVLLCAAFFWSIGSVYSRRAPLPPTPFLSTALQMICGGLWLIAFGLICGEGTNIQWAAMSGKSILSFVYLVFFGSLLGFTAYIWLLKNVGTAQAATYAFVNPIVAVFLGWAFAGEEITMQTIVAAVLIIAAVFMITVFEKTEVNNP